MNDDAAIQDLNKKIEREKALIKGYEHMRQATQNAQVQSQVDSQIRDARKNMQYFEQTQRDLQRRKMGSDMGKMSISGKGGPATPVKGRGPPVQTGQGMNNQQGYGYGGGGGYGIPGPGGYSDGGAPGQMPPRAPYAPPSPADRSPRARPNYSKLGTCCLLDSAVLLN